MSHNSHTVRKVHATITVGVNPTGIAITPNGKYAYVANNNNYSIAGQDSVTVIDLKTNLPIKTIIDSSFNGPYTITIDKLGIKAYVTNSGGSTITIINIHKNEVSGIIEGFDGPSGMVIKGDIGYVNNYGATPGVGSGNGKTVNIVDLRTNKIIGNPITVGLAPSSLALTSKGDYVYTTNYMDGNPNTATLTKIETRTNNVVETIGPFSENGFSGPFAIVLSSNGRKAYVTNFGSNNFEPFGTTVSVVDLCKNVIIKTINLGIQPSGIAISPDDKYAYVSNYNTLYAYVQLTPPPIQYLNLTAGAGTVNVVNLEDYSVISTILVGQSPDYVTVSPDGKHVYVTNYTSNTVTVLK